MNRQIRWAADDRPSMDATTHMNVQDWSARGLALCVLAVALAIIFETHPASALTVEQMKNRCPNEGVALESFAQSPAGSCLVTWASLIDSEGVSLYRARYEKPSDLMPEKYRLVTEVLCETAKGSHSVRLVWLSQADQGESFIESVQSYRVGKYWLVEIAGCLNGTGGCWQDFILWSPRDHASAVPSVRPLFDRNLPKGYTTYKAPNVSLAGMTIHGYGWTPKDANGSPTMEMECAVSFNGQRFQLANCKSRPRTP